MSEVEAAKYRIGDLLLLLLMAREEGMVGHVPRLRKQLRSAIAVARSIADQRNAVLRDEEETDERE